MTDIDVRLPGGRQMTVQWDRDLDDPADLTATAAWLDEAITETEEYEDTDEPGRGEFLMALAAGLVAAVRARGVEPRLSPRATALLNSYAAMGWDDAMESAQQGTSS